MIQPDLPCFYREQQRFNQWWLYALLGTVAAHATIFFGYGMFKQLVQGQPWGDRPMSNPVLTVVASLVILVIWAVVLLVVWTTLTSLASFPCICP